jgi:hypothetical protein
LKIVLKQKAKVDCDEEEIKMIKGEHEHVSVLDFLVLIG